MIWNLMSITTKLLSATKHRPKLQPCKLIVTNTNINSESVPSGRFRLPPFFAQNHYGLRG